MSYGKVIKVTEESGIAIVTISRPESLNALNLDVFNELADVVDYLEKNDEIKAVILTGEGNKSFVAGTDIGMMNGLNPEQSRALSGPFHETFLRLENLPKPVIAAVNGYALGGGCELTLVCDIRIASENAVFGLPETSLGIIPGSGGTQRLPKLIGPSKAKMMILGASKIKADKALEYGLVEAVVPQEELMTYCMDLAKKFIRQPSLALALAKRAINLSLTTPTRDGIAYETEAFTVAFGSEDKKQRMAAFLNKSK